MSAVWVCAIMVPKMEEGQRIIESVSGNIAVSLTRLMIVPAAPIIKYAPARYPDRTYPDS